MKLSKALSGVSEAIEIAHNALQERVDLLITKAEVDETVEPPAPTGATGPVEPPAPTGTTGTTGPVEPPAPTGPTGTPEPIRTGLFVLNGRLWTKKGIEVKLRGIEMMAGQDAFNVGYPTLMTTLKGLGANCVSPLFQGSFGSIERVRQFCEAARQAGLIVGVNADHQPNGRSWLNTGGMVELLNAFDHVFLECEVETDNVRTTDEWVAQASSLVRSVREVGHKHPLKVGAPLGGRQAKYPLAGGKRVLDADPLKNTLFTWQAYWKAATTTGWSYQSDNGFRTGIEGTKEALTACANSGLCFIPGFDWRDDVGETGALELMAHAHTLGLSYQFWVLFGDGMYPENNMLGHWNLSPGSITTSGVAVQKVLLAQRQFATL